MLGREGRVAGDALAGHRLVAVVARVGERLAHGDVVTGETVGRRVGRARLPLVEHCGMAAKALRDIAARVVDQGKGRRRHDQPGAEPIASSMTAPIRPAWDRRRGRPSAFPIASPHNSTGRCRPRCVRPDGQDAQPAVVCAWTLGGRRPLSLHPTPQITTARRNAVRDSVLGQMSQRQRTDAQPAPAGA